MKKRMINTAFWHDKYIRGLPLPAKMLFLYLLTNPHTNIVGIYEIGIDVISFEMGMPEREVKKNLEIISDKILYMDGWVCIKNYMKHQASKSPLVAEGARAVKEQIPRWVLEKSRDFMESADTPLKSTYTVSEKKDTASSSIDTPPCISISTSISNGTSINADGVGKDKNVSDGPNQILSEFYKFNPMINFANRAYRRDAESLIKKFGLEEALSLTQMAISIQGQQFAPVITDPSSLAKKLGALRSFISRGGKKKKGMITTV